MYDWNDVTVKTPPTAKPLTASEVREHLRLSAADEGDDYINLLIDGAVAHIDGAPDGIGYAMLHQSWLITQEGFPYFGAVTLPGHPVTGVTAIKYIDTEGDEQTLAADKYKLVKERTLAQVFAVDDNGDCDHWPTTKSYRPGSVTIEYTLGAADAAGVPADLKMAMLMIVGKWYLAREGLASGALSEIPVGASAIVNKYRWGCVA